MKYLSTNLPRSFKGKSGNMSIIPKTITLYVIDTLGTYDLQKVQEIEEDFEYCTVHM
jgi:hypothetical protein